MSNIIHFNYSTYERVHPGLIGTRCGRYLVIERTTKNTKEVTCKKCLIRLSIDREREPKPDKQKKRWAEDIIYMAENVTWPSESQVTEAHEYIKGLEG